MPDDPVKIKVRQLYHFLKEANQLRYRPIRQLSEQQKFVRLAEMPNHPTIELFRPNPSSDETQDFSNILLRIRRPHFTPCPKPPVVLQFWLLPDWDDPYKTPLYAKSQNKVITENFDDDPIRRQDFLNWLETRKTNDHNAQPLSPPESIGTWLEKGWNNPDTEPEVIASRDITITERFDDDDERVNSFNIWMKQRSTWQEPELVARNAMSFYERFYEMYVALEKDGENLELLAADGHFQWEAVSENDGQVRINHPILLKRVELNFEPETPLFTISETEREPELYSSLFVDLNEILPAAIRKRNADLERSRYHPWGREGTTEFLKAFIQTISPTDGEFLDELSSESISSTPRLCRDMVLVLRRRSTGIANSVNAIIDDIEQQEIFPPSLVNITGSTPERNPETLDDGERGDNNSNAGSRPTITADAPGIKDDDILLAMATNDEQLQIIRKLESSGSVIVQGPPGTGKTHTIGNLIGHLLAKGKSILVTAQTSKALRVVRDKIPRMLQPLAVSVLGSDQTARQQLKTSVSTITERMTSDSAESLQKSAAHLESERRTLLDRKRVLGLELRQALENEYKQIKCGASTFTPTEAARYVRDHKTSESWIPSPIKRGTDLTLTPKELIRAYALGTSFSAQEETDARKPLPDVSSLPNERQFNVMVSDYNSLTLTDLSVGRERWSNPGEASSESLAALASELATEFSDDLRRQAWRPFAIVAGIHGGTGREVWEKLIELINEVAESQSKYALVLQHRPTISDEFPIRQQHRIVEDICDHIENGGKLGFIQLATRPEWRQFIKTSSVSAGQPDHIDHFKALRALTKLTVSRLSLQMPWDELIGKHIQQPFNSLGSTPEQACRALIPEIHRCLNWHDTIWRPLAGKLRNEGLMLDNLLASIPREASEVTEYRVIETLGMNTLPPLLSAELGRRRLVECDAGFRQLERLTEAIDPDKSDSGCIGLIIQALRDRNTDAYRRSLEYTRRVNIVKPLVKERDELLERLHLVAPAWAQQIADRTAPHDADVPPGDISPAWVWRQLNDELLIRDELNANDIHRKIDIIDNTLREITVQLIDAKAWGMQLERLERNNALRQALVGWLDTTDRLMSTRQETRRQNLLSEGRKLMKKCADAVPVWVMPISIVAESFDPRSTRFDVVIIDEASQADINALIPLYLGKKLIIVGDHEQVTPLGVGQNTVSLDNLRGQILVDIPNSHLFDSKVSIYDIGRQSFGDGIRLVEHFRCVPEIIAFSNKLSYSGTIRPLRESSSSALKPACVPCHVSSGMRVGDTNTAEARRIVDVVKAMILHPLYRGKTIGIISMIGDMQSLHIQTLIHKELSDIEIQQRRIQVGNSSEFQGDERDVIFLSMVDSPPDEGPLRLTGEGAYELTKKRYNVAASRAKDQLWVVHSFDPNLHLKMDDLRLKLLRHVHDPQATIRAFTEATTRTESPFERAVLKILIDAGYRVTTQWQAGYYRIDMVVEGGGKRLAIECDGDRYHPIEKLAEDINRQTILERLNWTFVRIRGSAFYRDEATAMQPIFKMLEELEIPQDNDFETHEIADMSLVHELDEIISRGFTSETDSEDEQTSPPKGDTIDSDSKGGMPCDSDETYRLEELSSPLLETEVRHDTTDLLSILRQMGGQARLESFLRDIAKARGYQRLGKNVRSQLMNDLKKLARKKAIIITGDLLMLP